MAPRIPVYTQQVSSRQGLGAGPTGNLPVETGLNISGIAEGLAQAGQTYINASKRKEEEDAAAWSADQLSKARLDWTQQQIEREQNAPPGAPGYAGQISKDFDAYTEEIVQRAPTESARNYIRQRMTDLKTSVAGRGMEFEAKSRMADRLNKVSTAVDQSRITLDLDPSQYQQVLGENLATLNALDIPEAKKREIAQDAAQQLSFAAVSSRLRSDPYSVRNQLGSEDGGGASDVRALNADNRISLRNAADAEIKRREIEAKQAQAISRTEMGFRIQDATAAYMQGLQFDNPPTPNELAAVYGPDKGAQIAKQLNRAQAFGTDVNEYATLPIDQRQAFIEARQPGKGGVATEGFAEETQLFGQIAKNAQAINQQLLQDGAGYAIKYAPEVATAWQGVMDVSDPAQAPAAYQAYAEAVKGEQARLGLRQFQVLPESYVAQVTSAFKDPTNAGPRQIQMLDEMRANWGQHFPDVFRQMSSKLPDSVKVIGSGVDKDTATILSSISGIDTKTLKDPLPSSDVTAMTQSLEAAIEPFRKTFAAQHGGLTTFDSIYKEAERGALLQMASGKGPAEAAEDMATRLSANYKVDGTLRVPASYDIDTVQVGAQVAISKIKPQDVLMSEIQGVSPEFVESRFKGLMESASFVTNKDEDGVYLFVNGAAVLGKNGQPLDYKFDDLLGLAVEEPEKPIAERLPQRFR